MLARIHSQPNNLWRGLHEDMENFLTLAANRNNGFTQWAPSVDIAEKDDQYVLSADVPGVDPKTIEVLFEDGVLTLQGERENKRDTEQEGYYRSERMYGSFKRSFRLPDAIDAENIVAKSYHGVLEVHVPKQQKTQKKIDIQSV